MLINGMGLITRVAVPKVAIGQTPGGQAIKIESQIDPDSSNIDRIIAGAIYDFAGFLTTMDLMTQVGATGHSEPVINRPGLEHCKEHQPLPRQCQRERRKRLASSCTETN